MIDHVREGDEMAGHDDDAFPERVAGPLRAPERLVDGFEARVMAQVLEEPRHSMESLPWWRRRFAVSLSFGSALAMAAGVAVIVALGARSMLERSRVVAAAAPPDTVHVVRFVFSDARARRVSLVGDFNGWAANATPLSTGPREGTWTVDVVVPPGRHEYAFIVDGERWVTDPFAPQRRDDHGTVSSVVDVGRWRDPAS